VIVALIIVAAAFGVYILKNRKSKFLILSADKQSLGVIESDPDSIPEFAGKDYVVLCDNQPNFNSYDIENINGEYYSELDYFGRCGKAIAKIDRAMMPTNDRESIGMIKPSGWHTVKYPDLIEDLYLYNRCHLIAYGLTGQNANEKNLITGTRHMNIYGMLPFETEIMRYLDGSDNHVLYRVTPYFKGVELVARGVELEAYSIEDKGTGICFHVFVYNYQPGIDIDYLTGVSKVSE
jgi:DNA-entry nuclease